MVSIMFRHGTRHWENNGEKAEIFHAFIELVWKPSSKQVLMINILKEKFKILRKTVTGGLNLSGNEKIFI